MGIVDIILPNFNKENYLKETIDSILNQSFKDFNLYIIELIVSLNDFSPLRFGKIISTTLVFSSIRFLINYTINVSKTVFTYISKHNI